MLITAWKPVAVAGAAAAAILWSALSPAPLAAGPDFRSAFNGMDKNKDGVVTLAEFQHGLADKQYMIHSAAGGGHPGPFMMPVNHPPIHNGTAVPASMLKAEFAKEDLNHNGSVTFDEFKSFHVSVMNAAFAQLDANKDGAVEPAELASATAKLPAGAPHPSFAALDRNHDGKLSSAEFFGHLR